MAYMANDKQLRTEFHSANTRSLRPRTVGPLAAQKFDKGCEVGTQPAICDAFLQIMAAGIRSEIDRLFSELLQIGMTHSVRLNEHSAEWAKAHSKSSSNPRNTWRSYGLNLSVTNRITQKLVPVNNTLKISFFGGLASSDTHP
jgi:hypothetical protein